MLTRNECNAMRGLAILGIALHNYAHWLRHVVQENEYTYTQHNVDWLLEAVGRPSDLLPVHLLSFFGHYGVPVFLFLSAYGLVMKYERSEKAPREEGVMSFMWSHFRKLFMMMVVGYVAFVLVDYMTPRPHHYEAWNVVGQLCMVSNLYGDPDSVIWPGPYWYFGLMLQMYLIYRLVLSRSRGSLCGVLPEGWATPVALGLGTVATLWQLTMDPEGDALNWYRYNSMGALLPFAVGLACGRFEGFKGVKWFKHPALVAVVMAVLVMGGSLSMATWIWVPVAVIGLTVSLVKALPKRWLAPIEWVGVISAAIFVSHPIARKVIIPISHNGDIYAGLLLYSVAVVVLGVVFHRLQGCFK